MGMIQFSVFASVTHREIGAIRNLGQGQGGKG